MDEDPLSCKVGIRLKTPKSGWLNVSGYTSQTVPIIINGGVLSPADKEISSVDQMYVLMAPTAEPHNLVFLNFYSMYNTIGF